jgi:hypothetical protein
MGARPVFLDSSEFFAFLATCCIACDSICFFVIPANTVLHMYSFFNA